MPRGDEIPALSADQRLGNGIEPPTDWLDKTRTSTNDSIDRKEGEMVNDISQHCFYFRQ